MSLTTPSSAASSTASARSTGLWRPLAFPRFNGRRSRSSGQRLVAATALSECGLWVAPVDPRVVLPFGLSPRTMPPTPLSSTRSSRIGRRGDGGLCAGSAVRALDCVFGARSTLSVPRATLAVAAV